MTEHVAQYDSMAHWCVYKSFQETMELYGTDEWFISVFGYI